MTGIVTSIVDFKLKGPLLPTTSYPTRFASVLASTNCYTNGNVNFSPG